MQEAQIAVDAWSSDSWILEDDHCVVFNEELTPIRELADELERELAEVGYQPEPSADRDGRRPALHLGLLKVNLPERRILRGYLRPSIVAPIVVKIPERVMAFLIELPGDDHLLHRDNHGQLWHYHYANAKKQHSDTVLCWDTRACPSSTSLRPIFQEKHAERNSSFDARPELWGHRKKESMHLAVRGDLDDWPLNEFRCASDDAGPVWPPGSVLTPRPKAVPRSPKHPAKSKKERRR